MTAQGTIAPFPKHTFLDNNGFPAVGYHLHVFLAGTTTPTTTWSDAAMTSANTNPIILDSAGRCSLFIAPGSTLKFELALPTDTTPPTSPIWSIDGVAAVPPAGTSADVDVEAVAGTNLSAGNAVYLSDGTGGPTAGRWYKTDAGNPYSSSEAQAVGFATSAITTGSTGTIRRAGRVTGLAGLVAGAFQYADGNPGALTSVAPTNARLIAQADSATSVIIMPGNADANVTVGGQVNVGPQSFGGIKTFDAKIILSAFGVGFASGNILQNMYFARTTADFTKNANVSYSDVTEMAFPADAGGNYLFLFLLHERTAAAADWIFQLTGPAAPTALRFGVLPGIEGAASDASAFSSTIADGGTDSVDKLMAIAGYLRNGVNAGTVQLQAAQKNSVASNSVIYAESSVIALKMG